MRLLYRENGQLRFIHKDASTPYAILSHTWDKDEASYEEVLAGRSGLKLEFTLQQAERDGLKYVWIDSCCIDRRNNVELGKAINLMFQWYAEAEVCYAYLSDIPEKSFVASRWHTRGWTLQELLAPKTLRFYDCDGVCIGDRSSLAPDILLASSIEVDVPLRQVPLADRLRWSEKRQTTEPEDASYCMLGLLEVSLLFNYGEGPLEARRRLLDAVRKRHGERTGDTLLQTTKHSPCDSVDALHEALAFDGMSLRHQAISEPYRGTCEWLSGIKEYQEWLAGERRMIWIKGRPGTGKSTLLKHIEKRAPSISFYFNRRGGSLEHSVSGMYRSLLCQLIDQGIGGQVLAYVRKQIRNRLPWLSQLSLQQTFRYAASLAGSVRCYVDALDECDQQEVQQMVQTLEDSQLYVCFASRHYPAIVIESVSIEMAGDDLATFVRGRLVPELAEEVIRKAKGIFFWAVLVVDMLNNGHTRGVTKDIDALPGTLNGLLESVIQSEDNKERFESAMCLVLYQRPDYTRLTSTEFCALLQLDAGDKVYDEPLFVADVTRGLAEIVHNYDSHEEEIHLVHETVREVMLRMWAAEHVNVAGWAHETLAFLHLNYLQQLERPVLARTGFDMLWHIDISSSPELFLHQLGLIPILRLTADRRAHHDISADLLVEIVVNHRLTNILRLILSPGNAAAMAMLDSTIHVLPGQVDMRQPFSSGAYWHELCPEYTDCTEMISFLLSHGADVDQKGRRGRTPLIWAMDFNNVDLALLLLRDGADVNIQDTYGQTALHRVFRSFPLEVLVDAGADISIRDGYGRSAVEFLIEAGEFQTAQDLSKLCHGDDMEQTIPLVYERYISWASDACIHWRLSPRLVEAARQIEAPTDNDFDSCFQWWWHRFLNKLSDGQDTECADSKALLQAIALRDIGTAHELYDDLEGLEISEEFEDFVYLFTHREGSIVSRGSSIYGGKR